jgi:hypothetical protein
LGEESNKSVDHVRQFWQTGKLWYRGLDAEGNRVPVPIQEITNTGFSQHIEAFINTYQFWYSTLKDELGEDPNMITAAIQPRVTAENVNASEQASDYATDHYYRAYAEVMKITARKISCLLKDSVVYGANAYRKIVNDDAIGLRQFSTDIRFLPTQQELDKFEFMLNQAMQSNPDLPMFVNQFQLMQIAKEDVKMAYAFYNRCLKKMAIYKQQEQQQNQQATIQGQIQSAQAAEEAKRQTQQNKYDNEMQLSLMEKERIDIQGLWSFVNIYYAPQKSGGEGGGVERVPLPPNIQKLIDTTVSNALLPLMKGNADMVNDIQTQAAQAQMEQQQAAQQQQQPMQQQQQTMQSQPQAA